MKGWLYPSVLLAVVSVTVTVGCGSIPLLGSSPDTPTVVPSPTLVPLREPGSPPTTRALIIPTPTPSPTPTPPPTSTPTPTPPPTPSPTPTPTPPPTPTVTPTPTLTPTPSATPTPTSTPLPRLGFENLKVFGNLPSQVQMLFSLSDPFGRSIVVPAESIRAATRIFERGPGTNEWEEIDYAETNVVVHTSENFALEVVFVLDFSRSVTETRLDDGRTGSEATLDAFQAAVERLPGAHRVGVVEFHDRNVEPSILSSLTTDRAALLEDVRLFALSEFEPGSSRVWDSIRTAINLFTRPQDNPDVVRTLVFLTDGRDTSSVSTRDDIGTLADRDGVQLYALGVGDVFEEEDLAQMVESTAGAYYRIGQLEELQDLLGLLISDLRGQYRVSYITLRRQGDYETRIDVTFPGSAGSVSSTPMEVAQFYGPDNRAVITVDPPSLDKSSGVAHAFVRALHVPRRINHLRFRAETLKELEVRFVPEDDGGLLEGWVLTGPDEGGYYDAFGSEPLEFGNFGLLFQLTFRGIEEKSLEVPLAFDSSIYTGGKSISHPSVFYIGQRLPASGRIAFRTTRNGNSEIYVVNAFGGDPVNLTDDRFDDFLATWSPDGSRIAVDSNRQFLRAIYVMDSDGSNIEKLTPGSSGNSLPAWSFEGDRFAFNSDRDGNREIYVMDDDGSNVSRLTNNPADDFWPAWSPDGETIAFVSDRDGNPEIYVMPATGGEAVNLTNHPGADFRPAWSPDGRSIAFYSERDGNQEIYVMGANGAGQRNLTNNGANDWYPAWSPDGVRIAFATDRDGNREIYYMNTDGSAPQNLTTDPADDWAPAWGVAEPTVVPTPEPQP